MKNIVVIKINNILLFIFLIYSIICLVLGDFMKENQVEIYKKANCTDRAIKVILCFNEAEYVKVNGILNGFMLNLLEEYQC